MMPDFEHFCAIVGFFIYNKLTKLLPMQISYLQEDPKKIAEN
jgi:hypothetical protein